jgi:UPF0755 protein
MARYYLRLCKYLSYIIFSAIVYFIISCYVFLYTPLHIDKPQGIVIEITKGSALKFTANSLFRQQIIKHPNYFIFYAKLNNLDTKIKFGEYLLLPGITPKILLNDFVLGNVHKYKFTIIEGSNFSDLKIALLQAEKLIQTINYADLDAMKPEGIFYPDTYFYAKGNKDVDLLKLASNKLNLELNKLWKNNNNVALKTPYEALILASIIEKESGFLSELTKISGVYSRRLLKGMKLQADPTVVYALGDSYKDKIYYKDLKLNSPYNTYITTGLPPTPIAFPSKLALIAALNPEAGEELYFVADYDGKHIFSKNLIEHTVVIDKIRKKSKQSRPKQS